MTIFKLRIEQEFSMAFNERLAIITGSNGLEKLKNARVAVYGLGGVGAVCAMDLVRSGIGTLYVIDFDRVEESNLNRLYFGYLSTVGKTKIEAFEQFAHDVNPAIKIIARRIFFSGETAASIVDTESDFHADCVDSLNAKVQLIAALVRGKHRFIASMGTAGRLAPEKLKLGKIQDTRGCPLARSVRTRLKHLNIGENFPVVWSDEVPAKPIAPEVSAEEETQTAESNPDQQAGSSAPRGRKRLTQGSSPFVPQTAGHIMASWIVRQILAESRYPSRQGD